MNKPLQGQGYDLNATNRGFSLDIHAPDYVEPGDGFGVIINLPPAPEIPGTPAITFNFTETINQFQCFAESAGGLTSLAIVSGSVTYTTSNMPLISEGVIVNYNQAYITKAAILGDGVTAIPAALGDSRFMLNGGSYQLTGSGVWYVLLCWYDADGVELNVPILEEKTPFVAIVKEGDSVIDKLIIETGPSQYNNFLNMSYMTGYEGTAPQTFGNNQTGYFNPIKFGANIKVISKIDTASEPVLTQYHYGSQDVKIPANFHGTTLTFEPERSQSVDPYVANEDANWADVVNYGDISALETLSFDGGWYTPVYNTTVPIAVPTNNFSYYSVDNGNRSSGASEFFCSVYGVGTGESASHRLKIRKGLVTFLTASSNSSDGLISVIWTEQNLRINSPNIYPTGSTHTGSVTETNRMLDDGYIDLIAGSDYYVFLFKVIPNWNGDSETKAPQLVISKVSDTPNTAITTLDNGGGRIYQYYDYIGDAFPAEYMGWVGGETNDYSAYSVPGSNTSGGTLSVNFSSGIAYPIQTAKSRGYAQPACFRKDIAHIKWDSTNNKFIVKQLHTGPVMIEDRPIYDGNWQYTVSGNNGWQQEGGTSNVSGIVGATFTGYSKTLNDGTTNQVTGSINAANYLPKLSTNEERKP